MNRLESLNKILTKNTLTIEDSRTGKKHQVVIDNNNVKSSDFQKLIFENKVLRCYDPGYMNTSCCKSKISFIDGEKGILEYRGYPIEILAQKSSFLQVSYLLIFGQLPSIKQLNIFSQKVLNHTFLHSDLLNMLKSFRYDAHPMGMLCSTISAMSTLHPQQNPALSGQGIYKDKRIRNKQIYKLLGKMPTLAAMAYRHRIGRQSNMPQVNMGYVQNFLFMLDRLSQKNFKPHPKLVRALQVLFILHAQHQLNCSTSAIRHLTSSGVDVYSAVSGAAAALYGPKHGGANEAVLRMLEGIGKKQNIPQFIEDVKNKKKLMFGFGHRVYKNYDPRAKIVKQLSEEVFSVTGKEPLVQIAMQLQKIALKDDYFISRKLYPNVDFYSGVIYKAMGFPTDMFVVLFAIPRVAGWLSHWNQFLDDPQNKIVRPRQNYQGSGPRPYINIEAREDKNFFIESNKTDYAKRNEVSRNS